MIDAVGQYIKYIQYERKFSDYTIREYSTDIELFAKFLAETCGNENGPLSASSKDVREWLVFLLEKQESKATIHRRVSSLKSFFKYHLRSGNVKKNPAQNILLPKKQQQLPNFLEEKQTENLFPLEIATDSYPVVRQNVIIMLFYLTGMRRAELINLKVSDINRQRKYLTVLGKRNKQRNIPLPDWFMQQLDIYTRLRMETFGNENNYLFLTDKGKPLYPKFVYLLVRASLQSVTTMTKRSPHTLRHTFATHLLNAGADLNAIKELLGHTSLAATQVYAHNNFEKLKQTYKHTHPRS